MTTVDKTKLFQYERSKVWSERELQAYNLNWFLGNLSGIQLNQIKKRSIHFRQTLYLFRPRRRGFGPKKGSLPRSCSSVRRRLQFTIYALWATTGKTETLPTLGLVNFGKRTTARLGRERLLIRSHNNCFPLSSAFSSVSAGLIGRKSVVIRPSAAWWRYTSYPVYIITPA